MNKLGEYIFKNKMRLLLSSFVFIIFYFISSRSPLAGDDWAFFNNATKSGVLDSAVGMYLHWEGRFMTLLAMHGVIHFKAIWNVLNALMFAHISYLISSFLHKDKQGLSSLLLFFLMFSIKDNIRMETYTWITGSVYYGLPLWISLVYMFSIYRMIFENNLSIHWWLIAIATALYLPLGVENISIGILIITIGIALWNLYTYRKLNFRLISVLFAFAISYLIWALSPGSAIRLSTMPEWVQMNLFDKIYLNFPQIVYFVFIQNKIIILLLIALLNYYTMKYFKIWAVIFTSLVYGIGILYIFSNRLILFIPNIEKYFNLNQEISMIFWLIFIGVFLVQLTYFSLNILKKPIIMIFGYIATLSAASLLMSPVIGYRLMLFTVFYLYLVALLLFEELKISSLVNKIIIILLVLLSGLQIKNYWIKYSAVSAITQERELILEDYHQYSDQYKNGLWLPRYPIYTIHGGDIEIEDSYHMEAFKIYNNLPLNLDVIFYWKESY